MDKIQRSFGKPAPLSVMMQRGEAFFDAINETDIDEVLERSKRISRIAFTASEIAAEKLTAAGDAVSKQLVYAAYVGIGDITARVVAETNPDKAEELLTSDQTHGTLLFASKTLRSYVFDDMTRKYRTQGTHMELNDEGIVIQEGLRIPEQHRGNGCPYAFGNQQKEDYFTLSSDNIVRTYTEAYRRDMPQTLTQQITRRR